MYIYPYKDGSATVNRLSLSIPARKIKIENSRFVGNKNRIVINWGSGNIDNKQVFKCRLINHPDDVTIASNKLFFFSLLGQREWLPEWTTDREVAEKWAKEEKAIVVCRTILTGHSGVGIVMANAIDEMADAHLYTRYIPKIDEYRVHVFSEAVIDIQRKAIRTDIPIEQVNWRIRSHNNGFIYMRKGIEKLSYLSTLKELALETIDRCSLDFGAVDIIYNEKRNKCYVLEVNTAPGLEATTLERYCEAIRGIG